MAKILLAEDDSAMRQFIAGALERAGHDVTTAENGLLALTILEKDPSFALLLTDIVMPEIDGIELSSKALKLLPDLKIIFITGFAAMAIAGSGANDGAHKVISKPFHLGKLVDEVEQILKAS